jgi:hypothetical protein
MVQSDSDLQPNGRFGFRTSVTARPAMGPRSLLNDVYRVFSRRRGGEAQRPSRDVDHPAHLAPRLSMVRAVALLTLCSPSGMLPGDLYLYSHSKNFSDKIFSFIRLPHDLLRGFIYKLEVRAL